MTFPPFKLVARAALIHFLLAAVVTTALTGQVAQTRTDARAPAEDRLLPWRAEVIWRLSGSREDLLLSRLNARDVLGLPNGHVFVLDRLGRQIHRIDQAGQVLETRGRRGRGPGELSRPSNITLDPSGNVAVLDRDKDAFVRWPASGGQPLAELPGPAFFVGNGAEFVGGGYAYKRMRHVPSGSLFELVLSQSGRESVLARGPVTAMRTADFPSCNSQDISVSPLFAANVPWATDGRRIATVPDQTYTIQIFDGSHESLRITRPTVLRRVAGDMALRQARGIAFGGCEVDPKEVVRGFGYEKSVPAVAELRFAPNGELWVLRGAVKGERETIDVFAENGHYLGTLVGVPFPAAFAGINDFIATSVDSLDVPVLRRYRLIRP